MSLLSHARIACIRETILDTQEISIQANNVQMVMAFHPDAKAEQTGNWNLHIHEFIKELIETEKVRIQNLMIGGFLFKIVIDEESETKVLEDLDRIEEETRYNKNDQSIRITVIFRIVEMRMKKDCTMKTFLQLIKVGDIAADSLSKHAIRERNFSTKTWANFVSLAHRIIMTIMAMKLDIMMGKLLQL